MKVSVKYSKIIKTLVVILCFSVLINCGYPNLETNQIPKPNNSVNGISYPEFKTKIESSTNSYLGELKKKHNKAKSVFFTLKENTNWDAIVKLYDDKLTEKGFKRINDTPKKVDSSESVKYEKIGILGGSQTLILSLIVVKNSQDKKTFQFLFVGSGT